ncbi:DUF1330 domain-containing protein [Hyphomonas johnsonii]|uniref:DUF1330 domain-containing protein n=1 Tax=Hyphomonas johnsonii MHS-2 TaxID=1280950 RepID=A0A059FBH0_9PROT|nr:DUF1330 domain-containing protein [Hyphomonas johnsonii]KCZ87906.1 hypothetical protein HJO_16020 [Hyphomonas johnsonii MHS-2]
MPAFIVATVEIQDLDKFKAYATTIAGLAEQYGGESVVKGAAIDVLEGSAPAGERIVVTRFPDEASARAYIADPVYADGKARRAGAATVCMRLVVT